MRLTVTTQEKLQELLRGLGYTVRYEQGNFRGGYCLVNDEKVVLINKFFPLEGKINTLLEVIRNLDLSETSLSEAQQKLLDKIREETA